MARDILELARSQTEYFVRGIDAGRFAASLNISKPLSTSPEQDALIEATKMVGVRAVMDEYLEHPDQIDALLAGAEEGVKDAFAKHAGGVRNE